MSISWYIALAGILSSLTFGLLFKSQYDANIEARQQMKVLEQVIEKQNEQMERALDMVSDHANQVTEESRLREEAQQKTLAVSNELNKMRAQEAQLALQAPFERGNAANERRNAALMRFANTEDGD